MHSKFHSSPSMPVYSHYSVTAIQGLLTSEFVIANSLARCFIYKYRNLDAASLLYSFLLLRKPRQLGCLAAMGEVGCYTALSAVSGKVTGTAKSVSTSVMRSS